ncbi:carboxypeptidase-like regulatory domain-containing protein [Actinokineospora globicatena]|uniref:carboxypeptidase-like regulatory domain-containing protein n=1 Tax=Actinokineospora globicatena TaxID=103729 RepID=UPI0020A5C932|nr:carboxypeptidase-like regulatory domain-containing protein [Actinokineospora globicatena]MCP2301081.1 hypothetical protein [Actinokineospora globicatena]GLW77283.1 hypothetical protein Aglo01_17650 [Actinokineospora globicatena]GLW84117.1 hypothetical protein Aglo02_17570 [Actinokineospora globicatena]
MPDTKSTTTDASGRFQFPNLPIQVYSISVDSAPGGWVIANRYAQVEADGEGSAANLLMRGVRPLSDKLTASMRFTKDLYQVGDRAEIVVTLTNKGSQDITGVIAGCDRSGGEGPELRDVDLGELEWSHGVTVAAGQTRTFSITGSISDETVEWGGVAYDCDFGPNVLESPEGFPMASAVARVPAPNTDLALEFHQDLDDDWHNSDDELLPGIAIGLRDAITGEIVRKGSTGARGEITFSDIPAGPYRIEIYSDWTFADTFWRDFGTVFAGSCERCGAISVRLIPTPGNPVPPTPDTNPVVPVVNPVTPTTPAPQARAAITTTDSTLADTGANVTTLTLFALLTLLAGATLTLTTRKRRPTA